LWKEIIFLVNHAETRLAKIDTELFNNKMHRIAHLHLNTYEEDIDNRFHKNLFHTNRLYILPHTVKSEKDTNAIYNYRALRRENKVPKKMTPWEKTMWYGSSNHFIFIGNRWLFTIFPMVYVCFLVSVIDRTHTSRGITNALIFVVELLCTVFTSLPCNDFLIDITYLIATIIMMLSGSVY
jgi:hypothetical protein